MLEEMLGKYLRKLMRKKKNRWIIVVCVIIFVALYLFSVKHNLPVPQVDPTTTTPISTTAKTKTTKKTTAIFESAGNVQTINGETIPAYTGKPFVVVNNNKPTFDKKKEAKAFESYSKLDSLGRCGTAFACVCRETMPKDKREPINTVKPSGWKHYEYDFIDGKSLYNRCHLIGFMLTAENANEKNLITGTRYMNTSGMLPFENMVYDYAKETNHHILYWVKPIFKGDELVARGVQIQAYSLDDKGESVSFNVFCYNVQPGVKIDYKTGRAQLAQ